MNTVTVSVKDSSKLDLFIKILEQFDFVEIQTSKKKKVSHKQKHDFFKSAGRWKNRDITIEELRTQAWPKRI